MFHKSATAPSVYALLIRYPGPPNTVLCLLYPNHMYATLKNYASQVNRVILPDLRTKLED